MQDNEFQILHKQAKGDRGEFREQLQKYEEDRAKHHEKLSEEKGRKRRSTSTMQSYREFVQQTLPLETEGSGGERLRRVAAKWKQRPTMQDQLALENQKVM